MGNFQGRAVPISLSPAAARFEVVTAREDADPLTLSPGGDVSKTGPLIRMQQIDRTPLVLTSLPVPCACGRPLVGLEYAIFGDGDLDNARGSVYVRGVCLACGVQSAIFAPPAQGSAEDEATKQQARIVAEVGRIVNDVLRLRETEQLKEIA